MTTMVSGSFQNSVGDFFKYESPQNVLWDLHGIRVRIFREVDNLPSCELAHIFQRLSLSRWHDVLSCNYLCNSRLGHLTFLVFLPEFFHATSFREVRVLLLLPSLSSFIHLLFSRRHLTSLVSFRRVLLVLAFAIACMQIRLVARVRPHVVVKKVRSQSTSLLLCLLSRI